MAIRKVAISRNDEIYGCFLGIIRTRSGKLICICRESDSHGTRDFSHLVLRESFDDSKTRSNRRLLAESHRSITNMTTGIAISDISLVESARNLLASPISRSSFENAVRRTGVIEAARVPSGIVIDRVTIFVCVNL